MLKSIHVSILATLLAVASVAQAQDADTGTLSNTENFNQANNDGAIKNYNTGNQTWHQSGSNWHHAHMHPGAPDPGLMAKSIAEARQAMALDNQAQQMARNALQGLQSQDQQRNQFETDSPTNSIDVNQLVQIANTPDPAAAEVLANLASDGYYIAGEAAANAAQGAVATTSSGTAGAAPDVVSRSVASTTNNYGATINNGLTGPSAWLAGKGASPASLNSSPVDKPGINAADKVGTAAARTALEVSSEHGVADAQRALVERNRAAVMQQLGIKAGAAKTPEEAGPIRAKAEDIFQVVHNHYESLRGGGSFFEASLPAVTPQTRETLPEFSKGF